MNNQVDNIQIDGAAYAFKPNFSGRKTDSNPKGIRKFTLALEDDIGKKLEEDGWNIKWKPLPLGKWMEGDPLTATLEVSVRTEDPYRSEIYLVRDDVRYPLYDDELGILDRTEFEHIDMVIRPYYWKVNNKTGIKACLDYFCASGIKSTIRAKYMDMPIANGYSDLPVE